MPVDLIGFAQFINDMEDVADGPGMVTKWVGSALSYAPYVEFGTGPHLSSEGTEDFVASMAEWAAKKGVPLYPVIQSIREKGTEAHPHFRPAIDEAANQLGFMGFNPFIPGAIDKMVTEWALLVVRKAAIKAPTGVSGFLSNSYSMGDTDQEMLNNSRAKIRR